MSAEKLRKQRNSQFERDEDDKMRKKATMRFTIGDMI